MEVRFNRSRIVKTLSIATLLAAGAVFHAQILAQADVIINKIPYPMADSGIGFAPAGAGAVATPSAATAWGGVRSGQEATLSDRVVNYQIEATLDPVKHTVDGKQKLTWRNRSALPVSSVYLHLYMNAFESGNTTFGIEERRGNGSRDGGSLKDGEWGHITLRKVLQGTAPVSWSFVHPDNGPETDRTVVRFDLPTTVAPGASTTFDIDFLTQLPRVVARTGYFGSFHLVAQWFPKIGVLELAGERGATKPRWNVHEHHAQSEFYADFGNFDIKLTAPKDYTVAATGELQGAPVENKGMLTHHYVQGDVHDFAWMADKRSAKPLQDTWTGPGSPVVKLSVIYTPDRAASAAPAMQATKDALSYYSRTLGPYPYKTVTVVIPPYNADAASGMEYPTFFTATGHEQNAPGTLDRMELDMVTIHEFGHGYFYGILASNEVEEPFLDEGLNEYWNLRMLRDNKTEHRLSTPLLKSLGFAPLIDGFGMERTGTPREEPADAIGANAWERLQGIGPVYTRSAIMLRDLEHQLGKEATERAYKAYYQRWKFRHPSIADLRESLAEASGQRAIVERVFAQQVYATAKVDDRIDKFSSVAEKPAPGTSLVNGKRIEETEDALDERLDKLDDAWKKANPNAKNGTGAFPFRTTVTLRRRGAKVPQTLLVKFADGSSETVSWDNDQRWQRFTWLKPVKAVSAELDPQRVHYLDTSKLDDTRTLEANGSAARRWSADLAAIVSVFLSLIATI
ncbi:MAG: M1 family metallopeptidase [Pseudomonadota bacterium]